MFRQLVKIGQGLAKLNINPTKPTPSIINQYHYLHNHYQYYHQWKPILCANPQPLLQTTNFDTIIECHSKRHFHAAGSKIHYLDFRHRFKTNFLKLHLLIVRRQKMKKHRRRKFRRKFKCLLAKKRLKREIAKEKTFRVELLSMIRRAETFDPKEYALKKIAEINNKPKELSKEDQLEKLKELIRENRYQVTYIKPRHRRADI